MTTPALRCLPGGCGEEPAFAKTGCAWEELRRLDRHRHHYVEIASTGIDEALQGVGSDPRGGLSRIGLRVPFLATPDKDSRYLFMLASFTIAEGARVRIRGYRLGWTIGAKFTTTATGVSRVVEQEVTSQFWQPPNANVSWHLQHIDDGEMPKPRGVGAPINKRVRGIAYRDSTASTLLYESMTTASPWYVNASTYVPPGKGRPPGVPLDVNQGTFYDLRVPWQTHGGWLDTRVDGPGKIALYASVKQAVFTASPIAVPSPEETFIRDVVNADLSGVTTAGPMIWRVAGGLLLELDR
jgi:hypothetical protein